MAPHNCRYFNHILPPSSSHQDWKQVIVRAPPCVIYFLLGLKHQCLLFCLQKLSNPHFPFFQICLFWLKNNKKNPQNSSNYDFLYQTWLKCMCALHLTLHSALCCTLLLSKNLYIKLRTNSMAKNLKVWQVTGFTSFPFSWGLKYFNRTNWGWISNLSTKSKVLLYWKSSQVWCGTRPSEGHHHICDDIQ